MPTSKQYRVSHDVLTPDEVFRLARINANYNAMGVYQRENMDFLLPLVDRLCDHIAQLQMDVQSLRGRENG